jgi:hypothetical protein
MVWRSGLIWSGRVVRAGSVARAKRALCGRSGASASGSESGGRQAGEAGGGQPVAGGLSSRARRLSASDRIAFNWSRSAATSASAAVRSSSSVSGSP